jgi:hypothetical protein
LCVCNGTHWIHDALASWLLHTQWINEPVCRFKITKDVLEDANVVRYK